MISENEGDLIVQRCIYAGKPWRFCALTPAAIVCAQLSRSQAERTPLQADGREQ